jgi:hypothetical protein
MEGAMSLDVFKDLLGLVGALAMAVPFFKDFRNRIGRDEVRRLRGVFSAFGKSLGSAELVHTADMERASAWDLGFMLAGAFLLMASFAVSLYISAHR